MRRPSGLTKCPPCTWMNPALPAGASSRNATSAGDVPAERWSITKGLSSPSSHCAMAAVERRKKSPMVRNLSLPSHYPALLLNAKPTGAWWGGQSGRQAARTSQHAGGARFGCPASRTSELEACDELAVALAADAAGIGDVPEPSRGHAGIVERRGGRRVGRRWRRQVDPVEHVEELRPDVQRHLLAQLECPAEVH